MRYDTAVAIGRGASGEVFRAFDPEAGRQVALKLFSAADPESDRRRLREARAQQSLDHPSICEIYEVGVDEAGRGFIAMRYVDGEPLDEVARRLPLIDRVQLLRDVADAVGAAHAAGLVHRDLKPSNVLVEEQADGSLRPFVLDFGIVHAADETRLTETGQVLGTPDYLSPEQARGDAELSARSDVFSLGVLLYEVLTDRQPFAGESTVASLMAVLEQDPPLAHGVVPEVPRELSSVAAKAMEKDPRRRYADASALKRDLDRFLTEQQVTARQVGWWGRLLRRAERRPLPFALGALTLLTLLAAGAWSLRASLLAEVSARDAERFTRQSVEIASRWRFTQLLPRHDLTRERAALETALTDLRTAVDSASPGSQGAGAAAIGRASLALGRFDDAREELERALELGVNSEILVLDLARARLDAALDRLRRIEFEGDPAVRAAESERVQEELRAEVQPLLERAAARREALDPSGRLFALAVGAFVVDDLERARDLARQAGSQAGWLFEADLLVAQIDRLEASRARSSDDSEGARAATARERGTLLAALERAPSAPLVAQRLCEQGLFQAHLEFDLRRLGTPWQETYDRTADDCAAALAILPRDPAIRLREIEVAWRDALARMRSAGASQVQALDGVVERARVLVGEQPDSSEAWLQLGNALYASGLRLHELADAQSGEHFAEAAEALGRSTELSPGLGFAWQSLGLAWVRHGQALDRRGVDTRPSLRRAIAAFEAGLGGTGVHESRLYNALCVAHGDVAYWEAQRPDAPSANPRRALEQAIGACSSALERDPNYTSALSNLALSHWTGVDLAINRGESPLANAAEAKEAFARLLDIAPRHVSGRNNLAGLTATVARWVLDRGRPSDVELQQVVVDVDRGLAAARSLLEMIPADAELHVARLAVARAGALCQRRIQASVDAPSTAEVDRAWEEASRDVAELVSRGESIDTLLRRIEYQRSRGECEVALERGPAAQASTVRARTLSDRARVVGRDFAPLQLERRLVERLEERVAALN